MSTSLEILSFEKIIIFTIWSPHLFYLQYFIIVTQSTDFILGIYLRIHFLKATFIVSTYLQIFFSLLFHFTVFIAIKLSQQVFLHILLLIVIIITRILGLNCFYFHWFQLIVLIVHFVLLTPIQTIISKDKSFFQAHFSIYYFHLIIIQHFAIIFILFILTHSMMMLDTLKFKILNSQFIVLMTITLILIHLFINLFVKYSILFHF